MSTPPPVKQHAIKFDFPLSVPSHATIIRRALQVDKERNPLNAETIITETSTGLCIEIKTTTLRILRMNVNSLFDNLDLVIRTIDAFAPRDQEAERSVKDAVGEKEGVQSKAIVA